jgi:hypothetical protein
VIVEILGGPMDGQIQEVPDGTPVLHFVMPANPSTFFEEMAKPGDAIIEVRTVHLEIHQRRSDGMLVAVWPYPRGGNE